MTSWRLGEQRCVMCGLQRPFCALLPCVLGRPEHMVIWQPLPNPVFDTPEMREKMQLEPRESKP